MPQTVAYLEAVVGADITSFRRAMAEVRGDLTGMSSGIGQSLKSIGRDLTYALTVPLVAAGAASAKLAMEFDASARNIASISSDYAAHFDEYNRRILEFGGTTQAGSRAAMDALYEIYSAGVLNFAQAEAIMQTSVLTAEAGVADLTATTKGLTTAMLAFGAAQDEAFGGDFQVAADYFSNVLTRTVQLGVGSMDMFVTSIGRAGAAAATSGASYLDLGAAMAFLTQRGLTTYNAGTALNNLFNKMISPTDRMRQSFQQLGVTTSTELFEKFGDLGGVMEALYSTVGDNTEAWGEMFNTIQGKRAAFAIFEDIGAYQRYLVEFNTGLDTATDSARAEQLKSFSAQLKLMGSALETLGIQIGQAILPMLTPLVQGLTSFFSSLQNNNPLVMQLAVAFGVLVAAIGPLTWLVGTLLSPMGLFLGAIAAIVTILATDFQGIGTNIATAVNAALPSLNTLIDSVRMFVELITNPDMLNGLENATPDRLLSGVDWFDNAFADNPGAALNSFGAGGREFVVNPGDTISGIAQRMGLTQDEIRRAIGAANDRSIQPGSYRTGGGFGGAQFANAPMQLTENDFKDNSLQGRITRAWAQVGGFITQAIEDTLRDVVAWVETDGAFYLGQIVGSIAVGLIRAAQSLFSGVAAGGGGAVAGVANFASEFSTSFSAGIQQALMDAKIDPSAFDGFVANVLSTLITAFVTYKFIGALPLGGFVTGFIRRLAAGFAAGIVGSAVAPGVVRHVGAAIGGYISSVIGALANITIIVGGGALKVLGSVLSSFAASAIAGAVALGVVTGAFIYGLMPQETRDSIASGVLEALGLTVAGLDPDENLEAWRSNAEAGIYNGLAGIFDLIGDGTMADRMRELAVDAAGRAAEIIRQPFIDAFLEAWDSGEGGISVADLAATLLQADPSDLNANLDFLPPSNGFGLTGDPNETEAEFNERMYGSGKRAGKKGGASSIFKPMIDLMKADVATGLVEVNTNVSTGFANIGLTIDTATVNTQTSLQAFVAGVLASADPTLAAFSLLAVNMGIGMNKMLMTVTTYADLIIAKWNEMLATMGVAPVMPGSALTPAGAGVGGTSNNVNVFVTTNDPNVINNAFKKQGVDLKGGKGK